MNDYTGESNYTKNDFWIKVNEKTKKKSYYIKLNDIYVDVTKEIFDVCYYSYRKRLRDDRKDLANTSLDATNESNHTLSDIIGSNVSMTQSIYANFLYEKIEEAINLMDELDQHIAKLSLFYELSDNKIAECLKMKRSTVNYHKQKIFKLLRNTLSSMEEWL